MHHVAVQEQTGLKVLQDNHIRRLSMENREMVLSGSFLRYLSVPVLPHLQR